MIWFRRCVARSIYWPTLAYNYFLGRTLKIRRWWDSVDSHVLLGARPFRRDVVRLHDAGVTGVVNMCEEFSGPITEYARFGIEQLHLPTVDFTHPSDDFVDQGADFIERHASRDGKVYVHCKAGRARSATIVLWWLVKYKNLTPLQAQQRLLAARPHINRRIFQRPAIVRLYEAMLADQ